MALGRAAARALPAQCFLVGRDTRRSGPLLQAALSAGMASEGADVVDLGVLPTPGVAWEAGERGCPAAVVSASHNLFSDNGVKLFAAAASSCPTPPRPPSRPSSAASSTRVSARRAHPSATAWGGCGTSPTPGTATW